MLKRKKVLVAMSGGVDSSVAAALLKEEGYDVVGVTLQVWDYSKNKKEASHGTCCSHMDVQDARSVCDILNIPFYVLNSEELFEEKVIQPFVEDYLSARTPIPCANCNTFLKFHYLAQKMEELDCDFLATGHYAKVLMMSGGKYGLFKSTDSFKDQSYFLFTLKPELLPRILFPVGSLDKREVRKIALRKALPVFEKRDSTGICFIGKGGYRSFVEDYAKKNKLPISEKGLFKSHSTGEVMGEHEGVHNFTVGQRKGLGIPSNKALFVTRIDRESRVVWLGDKRDLHSDTAEVLDINWLDEVYSGEKLDIKVRFQDKGSPAYIYKNKNSCALKFIEPKKSLTPGQSAVFYRGAQVLGGGVISEKRAQALGGGVISERME